MDVALGCIDFHTIRDIIAISLPCYVDNLGAPQIGSSS
jgi:hypothetical protein